MGQLCIPEGGHYHQVPPFTSYPWVGAPTIARNVVFGADCAYDSAPYHADDVNKLFGLSFGLRGVHWNSARFGWRWSNADQCIELLAYVYREGERNWDAQLRFPVVAQVKPGVQVRCSITHLPSGEYGFAVVPTSGAGGAGGTRVEAPASVLPFGLTHGLYFGGELPAPHDMHVLIDRA